MKALIQRVSQAKVMVANETTGEIATGILVLLAIEAQDNKATIEKMLNKILQYRIFTDNQNKMNKSLIDIQGGLLVVSQFTLAANTNKGLRPSFSSAADPEKAVILYNKFVKSAQQKHSNVATGVFGADMQVTLTNDGPVTFLLEI